MARKALLSEEQLLDVISRYQSGERVSKLAQEFNVSSGLIYHQLGRHGISKDVNFRNLTPTEIAEVQTLYQSGLSSYRIAERYGVSRPAISAHLRHGTKPRRLRGQGSRKYGRNDAYFHSIDSQSKAYWLGFLTADGSIQKGRQLSVVLASKDADQLHMLAKALEANNPINRYCYPNYDPPVDECQLTISSLEMVKDLARLGIIPNKTFATYWPSITGSLDRHYLRGLVDGDGWFTSSKLHNLGFGILGTKSLMSSAQQLLIDNCVLDRTKLTRNGKAEDIVRFVYEGNVQCLRIANYLYEGATVYLPRKRDIVLRHYQSLPKYRDQLRFG